MSEPRYPHGTAILAEGGPYRITGRLLGDHDGLDGPVHVLTGDSECLMLNGWMLTIEVTAPPPPRRYEPAAPTHVPRPTATTGVTPRRRPSFWSRPWWKRQYQD